MEIVDVDFRYVVREMNAPLAPISMKTKVKVLQWRKKIPIISENKNIHMPYDVDYEWTEWQDVRTEEE